MIIALLHSETSLLPTRGHGLGQNLRLQQIKELATAGSEIVRLTVNDQEAADALPRIIFESNIPLVADIHYDHKMALAALAAGVPPEVMAAAGSVRIIVHYQRL